MRSTFASRRISARPAISSLPPTPSSPRTRRGSARRCSPGKGQGTPVELMSFRDGDAEAAGLADALFARKGEGARWAEMAVLYSNNFLSRAFEEALMRAKIPYRLVGDVGFYVRAEIKDALALLRLA